MRSLLHKAKSSLLPQTPSSPPPALSHPPPTPSSILSHRYHHGTNLGSIFVLEKWLYPSIFLSTCTGASEFSAVTAYLSTHGLPATRSRWETHWASALSNDEIAFLAHSAHITTLRLPIGYFTLGPSFCINTPFAPVSAVYENAWPAVLGLCERLYAVGIGVLLDFHALPGGANGEDHGGVSTGKAEFWEDRGLRELGKRCVVFVAEEVRKGRVQGCVGIQLCNEACWGAEGMWDWYEDVRKAVGGVDEGMVLYVSEGWDLGKGVEWVRKVNGEERGNPVVVATPRYYAFTDEDRGQSPKAVIERVGREFGDVSDKAGNVVGKGAVQVLVGEWSCALTPESWAKADLDDRDGLARNFGRAQIRQWEERACGSFFWNAKMEWMNGGEWGLFEMVKKGVVVPSGYLALSFDEVRIRVGRAVHLREEKKGEAVGAHVGYWDQQYPGGLFEHWRFEQGWSLGFADAMAFFEARARGLVGGSTSGADRIGALELWVMRRLRENGHMGGFAWEWEHGFRQGIRGLEAIAIVD